mgnify:FL=1
MVLAARNFDNLNTVLNDIKSAGGKALAIKCDVTELSDCENLIDSAIREYGRIDLLINNAGISQRALSIETQMEVERKIMNVNYFGAIVLTKLALPHMIAQKSGHIAIISSVVGKYGFPMRSGYSASKHALHGYFEALRAEIHKFNIKVTMVCPGRIKTNISINALTKDGSKNIHMEESHEKGMPVKECAKKILSGIKRGKKEVYIGGKEILLIYIKKFFPALFYYIIQKWEKL